MSKSNRDLTRDEILEITEKIKNRPFGEFEGFKSTNNKGMIGILIEEEGFEYKANTESAPDFPKAGLELKVTPYKRLKNNQLSAKERLVLNMINYNNESDVFENSSFWNKNKKLLILFYEHLANNDKSQFSISNHIEYIFPEQDLKIIRNDWLKINKKIKNGLAHEISEGDTMYLGACTKAKDSSIKTTQPFSEELAKPRAYSLKTTYMTQLVRKYIGNTADNEELSTKILLKYQSFEEGILTEIQKYYGKGQKYLAEMFDVNLDAKQANELILSKILNLKGKISKTEEFLKANISVKTIRLEKNNSIRESMSFPAFKYTELFHQNWEESDLYELLYSIKFLFVVFKNNGKDYVLDKAFFWNMPSTDIKRFAKPVWEKTKELISEGKIIKHQINGRDFTFFPDTKFNGYMHVRPHGKNKQDMYDLPISDVLTGRNKHLKHAFWFNSSYIKKIIAIE